MSAGESARQHYESGDGAGLAERVTQAVAALGDGPLSALQLGALDQFHVGGLAATVQLAALAAIPRGAAVLDAGSGLGGPSRYLAEAHGCAVTGVDLAPSFVAVARLLAERTGLADRVRYEVGDLLALPFPDASFDAVWTQHVVMNVPDRAGAYREFRRVLRPGGTLAFHDVLAVAGMAPAFPVPWAETATGSFLLTEAETADALRAAGLAPGAWRDVTAEALASAGAARPSAPEGLSLGVAMGPRFAGMAANLGRNLREGRVRLVMGVCHAEAQATCLLEPILWSQGMSPDH